MRKLLPEQEAFLEVQRADGPCKDGLAFPGEQGYRAGSGCQDLEPLSWAQPKQPHSTSLAGDRRLTRS
jgi:hypothetical protein